jgi:hypothetical protein
MSNKTLANILYLQGQCPNKVYSGVAKTASSTNTQPLGEPNDGSLINCSAVYNSSRTGPSRHQKPEHSNSTHDRLQRCMDAVQDLTKTIACAMSVWQGQEKTGSSDIHDSHARLIAELGMLPVQLECKQCFGHVSWADLDLARAASTCLGTCTCVSQTSSSLWRPCGASGFASLDSECVELEHPYDLEKEAGTYPPQLLSASRPSGKPRLTSSHLPDRAMMGAQPPPATQQTRPNHNSSRPYNAQGELRYFPFCLSVRDADPKAAIQYQAPGSHLGLVPANSNTPYSAAQPAAHSVAGAGGPGSWLPQLPQDANFPIHHPPQGYNAYLEQPSVYQQQWQGPNHASQEHLLVPQPAHTRGNTALQTHYSPLRRSRSTGQVTPVIRVATEQPNTPDSQVQPQDSQDSHHTSATSLYANYDYEIPAFLENSIHYPQQLNPEMADIQVQPQVGPSNGIASPISDHPDLSRPISPAPMTDPNLRKRSFSEMSQGPPHMQMVVPTDQQSPQGVAYETSPNGVEDGGHKVQRMIKRGDPPQAYDGKYYCNFAPECADQYFDRKCKWR